MARSVSCYIGAYSPSLLWRWLSSHGAITVFFIQPRDIYSHYWLQYRWFMLRWVFRGQLGFDCLITYDSSINHHVGAVTIAPVDHFSWDLPVDHSFEMMTDSSSKVSRVKDIQIIMTLCQASWFSQMGCETLCYSWFDHFNSSTKHLLRLVESLLDLFSGSRFVMTHHIEVFFPPHHFLAASHLEPP